MSELAIPGRRPAMSIREAQRYATERGRNEGKPNCYYWCAVWWRLHARESANPAVPLGYSRSQMRLFWDMKRRPGHYADWRRPEGLTDWQWSGLAERQQGDRRQPAAQPDKETT